MKNIKNIFLQNIQKKLKNIIQRLMVYQFQITTIN